MKHVRWHLPKFVPFWDFEAIEIEAIVELRHGNGLLHLTECTVCDKCAFSELKVLNVQMQLFHRHGKVKLWNSDSGRVCNVSIFVFLRH